MLERPRSVTIALRILWFFLLLVAAVLIAMFAFKWDVIHAQLIEESVNLAKDQEPVIATAVMIFIVVLLGAIFILYGWLFYMTGKGRNWARITLLVLYVSGYAYKISLIAYQLYIQSGWSPEQIHDAGLHLKESGMFAWTGANLATGLVTFIGYLIAFALLFGHDANAWFRSNKSGNQKSS